VDQAHDTGASPEESLAQRMLPREEYVEQAYFFKTLLQRLGDNLPMQEVMATIRHELLASTNMPMAIDFLLSELRHVGRFGTAMQRLGHYFSPFQTFLVQQAEDDRGRFDLRIALAILQREAQYRADGKASQQGIFLFQFETLSRNRLSYDAGLGAMAKDVVFDENWRDWIYTVRRQIGLIDLADLIYVRSAHYAARVAEQPIQDERASKIVPLFGEKEGKIALANRQKDPLLLFAALQRHLAYPTVPRHKPADQTSELVPLLIRRVERMEMRLKLLEDEQKGGIDLSKFYEDPGRGQSGGEGPAKPDA
jgi:hypothetical protein